MRIAIINDTVYPFSKGGVQKRDWEITRRLAQRGHEVHWYSMKYWEGKGTTTSDGVVMHGVCPAYELYVDGRRSIKQALLFSYRLLGALEGGYDIIDCSNFPYFPCFVAKLRSYFQASPLVITWYEYWGDYWREYLGWKGIAGKVVESLCLKLGSMFIVDSIKTSGDLAEHGVPDSKIRLIPEGVDIALVDSITPSREGFDVIYTGRLLSHKNVDMLIQAVSMVPYISCGIIGDGPERGNLEGLADRLGVSHRVKFFGFLSAQEDVFARIKASRVAVLMSARESNPLVVLESNACGVPIIMGEGAFPGIVHVGVNGLLCDFSADALAVTIRLALDRNMGDRCRGYARKFDWDKITDQVEAVYREAIA